MMLRHTEAGAVEYGLVNHQPSGEVYLMRMADGSVAGPIPYERHYFVFQNAARVNFDKDVRWANMQQWIVHNLDGWCEGCRE